MGGGGGRPGTLLACLAFISSRGPDREKCCAPSAGTEWYGPGFACLQLCLVEWGARRVVLGPLDTSGSANRAAALAYNRAPHGSCLPLHGVSGCPSLCQCSILCRYGGTFQNVSVKLPITLNKFFQPTEMVSQDFFQRWKQLSK